MGCETVVDVPIPPHESELVVHSFFTPDSPWLVRVTDTVGFTSADSARFIEDAVVEIWQDGQRLAQLARTDSGTYTANTGLPAEGQLYTLRAMAPGYPLTEGQDHIPAPVPVTAFQETLVPNENAASRRRTINLQITLQDDPGTDNFYGLGIVQGRWQEDRQTGTLTPLPASIFGFESDDPVLGESDFAFLDTEKTYYREAFFPDDLFAGSTHTLDIDIQYDTPDPDATIVVRRVFSVILLSTSEAFYRYWTTAQDQAIASNNPFAEPLRVHSNMTQGFGVFAGFQYRLLPIGADSLLAGTGVDLGSVCGLAGLQLPICNILPLP